MHAATFHAPSFRPTTLVQSVADSDTEARLITEVLARLWDLVNRPDAETVSRLGA